MSDSCKNLTKNTLKMLRNFQILPDKEKPYKNSFNKFSSGNEQISEVFGLI
jgi:hypothetical protein